MIERDIGCKACPAPIKGEVVIKDIIRELIDGSQISIFQDPEDTFYNLDQASLWVIENSTDNVALATFTDLEDGRFDVVRAPSGGAAGTQIQIPLPAHQTTTVRLPFAWPVEPTTDTIQCCLGAFTPPAVAVSAAAKTTTAAAAKGVPPGGFGPCGIRKMKYLRLRLYLDHPPAQLSTNPLFIQNGKPVRGDKWTVFMPGKNEAATGTYIPRTGAPAEVPLFVALIDTRANVVSQVPINPKHTTAKVAWEIQDPSRHSGIATNVGEPDDTSADLSFRASIELLNDSTPFVLKLHSAGIPLYPKDYAAEGRIEAKFSLVKVVGGSVFSTGLTTSRALPYDTDGDHLPDRWENDVAEKAGLARSLTRLDATTDQDEDRFHQSGKKGDGLSAWEEYRGLYVDGKHVRPDEMPDDTPEGNRTIGMANRGGPFQKDVFLHDTDGLFALHGHYTRVYGVSAHLITTRDSFVAPAGAAPQVRLREGQINRTTPRGLGFSSDSDPIVRAQFRLKIEQTEMNVGNPNGQTYGSGAGTGNDGQNYYRHREYFMLDFNQLERHLKDPLFYKLKPGDKPPDGGESRYTASFKRVLAHELGHRLTLRHPMFTTTVRRVIAATTPLDLGQGELAALVERPDGVWLRARAIVEERPVPEVPRRPSGELRKKFIALQIPKDISVGSVGTRLHIGSRVDYEVTLPTTVRAVRSLAGPGPKPLEESITERTGDFPLDAPFSKAVVDAIRDGHLTATVRFWKSTLIGAPPKTAGFDWMDNGSGSFYFPATGVPPPLLEILDMKEQRPLDRMNEEEP